MPELPEVETTRRGVAPYCERQTVESVIVRDARLRWPVPGDLDAKLKQQQVLAITRRAKYLLFKFAHGTLLLHLGMSGSLRITDKNTPPEKHDHLDIVFAKHCLRLRDPRRFGAALWTEQPIEEHALLAHLGPEPLTAAFDADYLYQRLRKRSCTIKTALMDNKIVVGVGNIYANEALFAAGIRPSLAAGKLSRARTARLTDEIKSILSNAIEQGGTTLRDFVGAEGKPGYFAQALKVYHREGQACLVCGTLIKHFVTGQRATFYCPACQK